MSGRASCEVSTASLWYRFTTLGDGEAGTQIALSPGYEGTSTALVRGEDGRISAGGQAQVDDLLKLGAEANDALVM